MAQSLEQYIASVRSRFIDVDGWFGAQCWDQWSHYATNFIGVPALTTWADAGGSNPHSGYACNVHHNAHAAGLGRWFEILPASATPRAGDVAFWEYGSAWYPWSHVATVLNVVNGGRMLRCLTQNPGAVQIADLITNGIIGYLRPRILSVGAVDASKTPTLTNSQKEDSMSANIGAYIVTDFTKPLPAAEKRLCVIFNSDSGFYTMFSGVKQEYINEQSRLYGVTRNFGKIGKAQWETYDKPALDRIQRRG
ncbi:CHAP domain-containing protein [Leucobacter sp. NPDC077196]|uniref:CHAP domain-containing protein n=1 Tax=Leucobacter sp. NPDC077196 TaxID=3154959 RepID=UPI00342D67DA